MFDEFFKGKKITLMGLGLLGRGIGDAVFMAQHGADLIVTDMKTEEELKESVEKLSGFPNVKFSLGGHKLEDFQNRDLIIRAANVPLTSEFLKEAEKNETPIDQSVSLFVQLLAKYKESVGKENDKYLVGVTGSKGKTTTTHLLYEMLVAAFPKKRVRLGGNIQGVSTLSYLDGLQPDDIFVLELDSWQLKSFGDAKMSPHVSVFTTFLPDHMNYYLKAVATRGDSDKTGAGCGPHLNKQADPGVAGGDSAYNGDSTATPEAFEKAMDWYFKDKSNIFCFQDDSGVCFSGESVAPWVLKHNKDAKVLSPVKLSFEKISNSLIGAHNEENIACAASAAHALGVPEKVIRDCVANYKGIPGRLQFVKEESGIKYYNDTTATMPDATRAALEALSQNKNIVLIFGGADKQVDVSDLAKDLHKYCKALVILKGTGTEKVRNDIDDSLFENVVEVENMQDAVKSAKKYAQKGDIILLSPAFASFGMFTNEYDRGDQYMKEI